MKKSKGTNLSEYSIIIGLVFLVIIPVCLILGQAIYKSFKAYSDVWETNNQNMSKSQKSEIVSNVPEVPQSKSNTPTKKCENGYCSIDFGKFMLTGLPEDFNNLVETSGAAGGTRMLSNSVMQLADVLKAQGNMKAYEKVKELSIVGHNIAGLTDEFNKVIASCNGSAKCVKSAFKTQIVPKPKNFDTNYSVFNENTTFEDYIDQFIKQAKEIKKNKKSDEIGNQLLITLKGIAEDPSIPADMKGVISELGWDVGMVTEHYIALMDYFFTPDLVNDSMYYDPLTLEEIDYAKTDKQPIEYFETYNASEIAHFDSALICSAGMYTDTGTQCH